MPKKRGNGDGSIYYSEQKKKWVGQVTVGRTDEGKVKRKTVFGGTKKEVKDKIIAIKSSLAESKYVDKSNLTLKELIYSLIQEDRELNLVGDSAYLTKEHSYKRICSSAFASSPIQSVTENDIKKYLKSILDYSNSIIGKDYALLKRAFREAQRRNIINSNLMDNIRKPKSNKQDAKVRALTLTEQRKLLEILQNTKILYSVQMQLMLLTGLRMGEINALEVDDVNLNFKVITVKRTVTRDEKGISHIGKTTKTYAGQRKIPLSSEAVKLLTNYMNEYVPNSQNLLFLNKSNKVVSTSQVNNELNRALKKFNIVDETIDGKISLHSLRHTYATRCIESGMSPKILQTLLGHTDVSITLNTYCDAFAEYKDDNIRQFEEYMKLQNLTS